MSMYKKFQADKDLETSGTILDYGDFRVKVARAGGSNKRFAKALEREFRPVRRQFETGTLDNKRAVELLKTVYAEAIVLDWQVPGAEADSWVSGIEDPATNEIVRPTPEVIKRVFDAVDDLFMDIKEQAEKLANFQHADKEDEAGN